MGDVLVVMLDVQSDATWAHRRIGEGGDDRGQLRLGGIQGVQGNAMPGHGVELDEDVLHVLVSTLSPDAEHDVADAVAVEVDAWSSLTRRVGRVEHIARTGRPDRAVLPAVGEPVAVRVK